MKDMLVYATPYKVKEGCWGYKWFGFYNGKRFMVIGHPEIQENSFNEISGEYYIKTPKDEKLLPEGIRKVIYAVPLSNHYFESNAEYKETTFEIVMQIIERGYDIEKVKKEHYDRYREKWAHRCQCKYVDTETGKVIVIMLKDKSLVWEEKIKDLLKELKEKHIHDTNVKKEYLIKTLSRTKRKDYENYVIGAIWHRLNNLEIKPVSQQYVQRSDGKYALLDLYFPQINVGIECDEAYHEHNVEPDKIREANVEQALLALQTGKDFTLIRINANTSIDEFEKQIDKAVELIIELYNKHGRPKWSEEKDSVSKVSENGKLDFRDNLQFPKIIDIAKCFGRDYKAMQSSTFFIDKNTLVWCPKLAIEMNGELKAPSTAGWLNVLSEQWDIITTFVPNDKEHHEKYRNPELNILIFAQSKNTLGQISYRFLGVYAFNKSEDNNKKITYKRISEIYSMTE